MIQDIPTTFSLATLGYSTRSNIRDMLPIYQQKLILIIEKQSIESTSYSEFRCCNRPFCPITLPPLVFESFQIRIHLTDLFGGKGHMIS